MEYFLIRQDERYANPPLILNLMNVIDKRNISKERASKIQRVTAVYIKPSKKNDYLDVLDRQMFLVSRKLKKLIEKYEPNLIFKTFSLIQNETSECEEYYLPILEEYECLADSSEFNRDGSRLNRVVLDEKKIGDKSIFKLGGVGNTHVIIRLDMAESILRREFEGIKMIGVETEEEGL